MNTRKITLLAILLATAAHAEDTTQAPSAPDTEYDASIGSTLDDLYGEPMPEEYAEMKAAKVEAEAEPEEEIVIVAAPPSVIKTAHAAYSTGKSAEVLRLLKPFAEMNDSESQYQLGRLYASKPHKMQDYKQACAWWQKAAKLDHPAAQVALAECYANGRGVEQSNEKAVIWWEQAATLGNLEAQYTLGTIYHQGKYGVKKDNATARKWFEEAASQGMYKAAAMANKLK